MASAGGADDLDAVAGRASVLEERHGQVEGGLSPKGGQQGVGALALDDGGEHAGVSGST